MSKVEELRKKYPRITSTVFNKFVEGDKTKTKKYLAYMLEIWKNKDYMIHSKDLVELVNMFDDLLPFIPNKDIYHKDYQKISFLTQVLDDAMLTKEEKSFVREEHVDVLFENENYILVNPKTHKGSLKYGAKTKWCTASRTDENTFNSYTKNGFLSYLICKKGTKGQNYSKIAFYSRKNEDPLLSSVETYDASDHHNNTITKIVDAGWDVHEIFNIISVHRANFCNWKRLTTAKENILQIMDTLSKINFQILNESVKVVESYGNIDYIENLRKNINDFVQNLKVNI